MSAVVGYGCFHYFRYIDCPSIDFLVSSFILTTFPSYYHLLFGNHLLFDYHQIDHFEAPILVLDILTSLY